MTERLNWIQQELESLKDSGLLPHPHIEAHRKGPVRRKGRGGAHICSNNYLGLANHTRLKASARAAI